VGGDDSEHGMLNSYGCMMNYKYNLDQVEANNEKYVLDGDIQLGEGVEKWL
jgi:hypothetical protein|tara:strand:- start:1655 stop:1807 length:153 start_codon:yes stop_codon:yes gene_type:complete